MHSFIPSKTCSKAVLQNKKVNIFRFLLYILDFFISFQTYRTENWTYKTDLARQSYRIILKFCKKVKLNVYLIVDSSITEGTFGEFFGLCEINDIRWVDQTVSSDSLARWHQRDPETVYNSYRRRACCRNKFCLHTQTDKSPGKWTETCPG